MKTRYQKYIYMAMAAIPVIIGIIGLWALLQSPYTGLNFEQKEGIWHVSSIDAKSPASQYPGLTGKGIVSIEGWQLGRYDLSEYVDDIKNKKDFEHFWDTQKYLINKVKNNSTIELETGTGEKIAITASSYPVLKILTKNAVSFTVMFLSLLIALLVAFKKPDNIQVEIFFLMILAMSIYIISVAMYTSRDIVLNEGIFSLLVILNSLAGIYIGAALLHFCLIFPKIKPTFYNKAVVSVIYISPLLITIAYQLRISWPSHYIFTFACLLGAMIATIHTVITLKSPTEKSQTKIILWGVALFLISASALHLFPILILGHRIFNDNDLFPLILIIPVAVAFAIMKYGLMDIDTLFDNTLIYSVTIGLLAIIDLAIVYILTSNKIPVLVFKEPFPTIIAVWVIIFTYLPVRNKVRDIIKRLLKREIYDLNEISTSYSKSLLSAYSIDDVTNMAHNVIEQTLHPKNIEIELFNRSRELQPLINTEAGEAFIPLSANTGAIGLIMLGEKHSGRLYDRGDLKLLDAISNQTALAIESIRHREGMRQKEEENREEKERISKEIHDGIGSSLVQAKLLLNRAGKDPNAINEALNVIDGGIREVRELIWVVEQDEQTLGDLIYHIEGRLEQTRDVLNINIETKIEDESRILTPEQKRNISRIVQESITNIIKHAQASRVDISFIQQGKDLEIIIRDNGKGLDTSKISSESYGLRNMRARAEKIGAQFSISSGIGKGTEIKISAAM